MRLATTSSIHTTDRKGSMMNFSISFQFLPDKTVLEYRGHKQTQLERYTFEFWPGNLGQLRFCLLFLICINLRGTSAILLHAQIA